METAEKMQNLKPYWLLDEHARDDFKHYLSQFITARCPNCDSRKVFVDGEEHLVQVNDMNQLLAAYYAVCDECSHVWCRAASPDRVVDGCLSQTADLDIEGVKVPIGRLTLAPVNGRQDGEPFEQRVEKLVRTRSCMQPIAIVSHSSKQEP